MKSSLSNEEAAKTYSNFEKLRGYREKTLEWVRLGKPLNAEDEERKIDYIQARTGIKDREKARKVADYDDSVFSSLSKKEASAVARATRDEEPDFQDVYFLQVPYAAASTVGRVLENTLDWRATGFMISKELFMTNHHVIPDIQKAQEVFVEFNFELDVALGQKSVTRFALAPDVFFMSSPWPDGLDFTIVAVGNRVGDGNGILSDFGFCPINEAGNKHALGMLANIVGHPEGECKKMSIRRNRIAARDEEVLQYFTPTEVGSSGSPVFNSDWEPIALHHAGVPTRDLRNPDGTPVSGETNEGIRISAIIKRINSEKNDLRNEEQLALIEKALTCKYSYPSLLHPKRIIP